MAHPQRIVDLHTHLFNARYIPLAGVIAGAMRKEESRLANAVAKLLEALTGSSYQEPPELLTRSLSDEPDDEAHLERLWRITEYELHAAGGSLDLMYRPVDVAVAPPQAALLQRMESSTLRRILDELAAVDYVAEGWTESASQESFAPARATLQSESALQDFFAWAERVVKKALRVVTKLMDPEAWGEVENYLEFFLTMLKSEEDLVAKLFAGYGTGLPPLQVVHFMMDMQMAYKPPKAPYYEFATQLDRMQQMQRRHAARVFGFAAFDPRRQDWKTRAQTAIDNGFIGFKFYPAMGYRPSDDVDAEVAQRIADFFDFCVKGDHPVFTHCTPVGFQTAKKLGGNAHPRHWAKVLADPRWSALRICFGHAGGGDLTNGMLHSHGWMAKNDAEWTAPDNFGRIVADLCARYPNAYCEFGYITQVLDDGRDQVLVENIERARKGASDGGLQFDLLDKLCYGSDWHMPDMVDGTRRYLDKFLDIMNRGTYRGKIDDFFWRNAYAYLKLPH